jgi:hypothetical protein
VGATFRRRAVSLAIAAVVALASMPLEADPAEAARFKVRIRSNWGSRSSSDSADKAEVHEKRRFRVRSNWGSRSSSSSADKAEEHEKGRPKAAGAAAKAAHRARAALEAEKAKNAPVVANPQRLVPGKTTDYQGGVTCLAGC